MRRALDDDLLIETYGLDASADEVLAVAAAVERLDELEAFTLERAQAPGRSLPR
ncbi:hypothetical protein ABIQ69_08545 [Agromyces sp. G08B096]|uniref:Uncharacterized protein n=1 Tax=Agromyces sp. G08B096 TaxID=3156399 RepID=A0AAU7WBU6_9MICO